MTYALCGFANFGSLGILIGGLTAMVPERRDEVLALGHALARVRHAGDARDGRDSGYFDLILRPPHSFSPDRLFHRLNPPSLENPPPTPRPNQAPYFRKEVLGPPARGPQSGGRAGHTGEPPGA